MLKRIKGKYCDTASAKLIGAISSGKFGDPAGYEEQLFINRNKQNFLYVAGGPESKYPAEDIQLFTEEQAEEWQKLNMPEV